MLGHTKKRRTETVEARFVGTPENIRKLRQAARAFNVIDTTERKRRPEDEEKNWTLEEAFPETVWNAGGASIRGGRAKEGLTQRQLAELTGIPQRHISEMENGKRPIGKETARKLAKVLKVDYRVFL
jgi:ribosome-binding protein aMBF1 (putative translation factor)